MNVSYYKAIVYGEPKCGKKSLIKKLTNEKQQLVIEDKPMNQEYIFDFQINNMEPDEDVLCLIYIVDLTKENSLTNIETIFIKQIKKDNLPIKIITILVGNKVDLEDDRAVDQDDEVSCLNKGTNIGPLVKQISNKAKFILKNQQKRPPAAASKSPRTLRDNAMISQKINDKTFEQVEVTQSVKPSQLIQSLAKQKDVKDVRKDQKEVEKNRQSNGDSDASASPTRKKFDFKDKLKKFKRDTSEDDRSIVPEPTFEQKVNTKKEPEEIVVTPNVIADAKQSLKKVEVVNSVKTNNFPKPQENAGKNEFLSKFQKITQKSEQSKSQELSQEQIEKNKQAEADKQQAQKIPEQKTTTVVGGNIKKFENVESSQKQEPKIQPSRASIVKRNSILNGAEQQLNHSNSRNSISSNKQSTQQYSSKKNANETDLKTSLNSNKVSDMKNNNYNSKDEDKRINPPSSHQSQRSDNNNQSNQGGSNLLEQLYKNKITNTNKLPPNKSEIKNSVKFSQEEEIIDNKRKNSEITNRSRTATKDLYQEKNAKNQAEKPTAVETVKQEEESEQPKKKLSPFELLKMKPNQGNTNNTTGSSLSQNNSQKNAQKPPTPEQSAVVQTNKIEQQGSQTNKQQLNSDSTKLAQGKNKSPSPIQNDVFSSIKSQNEAKNQSHDSIKIEQTRKVSYTKSQPLVQKKEIPAAQKMNTEKDYIIEEKEENGETQLDKNTISTPKINVLQCSVAPNQKKDTTHLNIGVEGSAQNSAQKSINNNSLNEYLENENLVNKQNALLTELFQQPTSADRINNLVNSEYISQNEVPQPKNSQNPQQVDRKLVKSDYSDAPPQMQMQNNSHLEQENNFLNMPNQLKIYESTVINKNNMNPQFFRASFDDVPNIMNPSSNDSSLIHHNDLIGEDYIMNKNLGNKQLLQENPNGIMQNMQMINNMNQSPNTVNNQANSIVNDPNFNSFNLKDPITMANQFSQNNQPLNSQIQYYQQNQGLEFSPMKRNSQPIQQYQSFQDKQGYIQEMKQQNNQSIHQSSNPSVQHSNPSQQQSLYRQSQYSQHQQSNQSPQQQSVQQNQYQSQQQALDALYNIQLNSQKQQILQQSQPQNAMFANGIQQQSQHSQQFPINGISPNSVKTLNQSPQQLQAHQEFLNQFGSQISMGGNNINQTANNNLSGQYGQTPNLQEQDIQLQQLLKQVQSNSQNSQNQLTIQLIQQLLQNQQTNQQLGQKPQIPSSFSFAQNQNNLQFSPYAQGSQQQVNPYTQQPNAYTNPFDQQIQLNQNNMSGIQQPTPQQLINQLQLQQQQLQQQLQQQSPPNNSTNNQQINPGSQYGNQQIYQFGDKKGINDVQVSTNNNLPTQIQSIIHERSNEEAFGNASRYSNNPDQDGKVSRFSIHTNNKTPEPNNYSGLNTGLGFLDNNNQFKDPSVMVSDIEMMRLRNINKPGQQNGSVTNGVIYNNNSQFSPQSLLKQNENGNQQNQYYRGGVADESNYPKFGVREYGENRGRTLNQNPYYQQQNKEFFNERQFAPMTIEDNYKRDFSEGGGQRKSYEFPSQNRDFQNSSHIDELLREVNNISLNKSARRNKQTAQSLTQSQIRSYRNPNTDNQFGNTSNILLNISSNMMDKSGDDASELTQLDHNIKALEESIENLDTDLRHGRIQQKIKSKREYNNQNIMKDLDTSAPLLDVSGLGQQAGTSTLRSRSQNEKSPNNIQTLSKQQGLAQQFTSNMAENESALTRSSNKLNQKQGSSIPVYETNLLSSRKSPQKEQLIEEIQLTLGKPLTQPLTQFQRQGAFQSKENTEIIAEIVLDNEGSEQDYDPNSMLYIDMTQDTTVQTQRQTSRTPQQNFNSKKSKPILSLNVEFEHQKLNIDVFGDDTSFSIAERFFTILNKTASRNQIKKLSQIVEKVINKYTFDLSEIIEKIEKKKLKERDTLECFIREKNVVQQNSFHIKNYDTTQVLSTRRNTSNNSNRQLQEVIGKIKIEYHKKQLILQVKESDDPHELAFIFIQQNNLPKNKINYLVEQITSIQTAYSQKKKGSDNQLKNNSNIDVHFSPTHHGIGRYYGQLTTQSMSSSFIGSPNKFQSPTKNPEKRTLLFQIKFDLGNGQFIHLPVHKNDNLKKLAFEASQNYKLSHEQYQKIYECLEKTYKVKRESSWTKVYSKK